MIILPIIIPLFCAALAVCAWRKPNFQRGLALLGSLAILFTAIALLLHVRQYGIQTLQVGDWPAPYGISLIIDLFSAIMLCVSALVGLSVAVFSQAGIDERRTRSGYYALFFFLIAGVNGAFITGDLFNLYVWFEVMLMASFVLIALGGERAQLEGAIKYVILNLISSTMFLSAAGLTYNLAGTLNMADLAIRLSEINNEGQVTLVAVLFLVAFGIKSAIFPLFFWLPASYHTPPIAVTALFSGLLTKVGIYALFRVFTLIFIPGSIYTHSLLLILAAFTMTTGVFGAAAQTDFRRLLSFHIISQIGYLIMALGLYSQQALASGIYFMVHVILAKTALFLVAGVVNQAQNSYDLKRLGGLYNARIGLSILFLLPALSLAGIPPLSGFFAKLLLVTAGFSLNAYWIVAVGLGVSVMTLYSMTKVWNEVFWKSNPSSKETFRPVSTWMWSATIGLVICSVLVGLFASPLLNLANEAAAQLADPNLYINAVQLQTQLGDQP
jgi:multicomponent Na+:H+ antiporter subunit D